MPNPLSDLGLPLQICSIDVLKVHTAFSLLLFEILVHLILMVDQSCPLVIHQILLRNGHRSLPIARRLCERRIAQVLSVG